MKKPFIMIVIIFSLLCVVANSQALEKKTHEALNRVIAVNSGINDILILRLGLTNGLGDKVGGKFALDLITDGGSYEDDPIYLRSANHFHDPISNAGFKGGAFSARTWAQEQGLGAMILGGRYGWKNVREDYYTALTGRDFNGNIIAWSKALRGEYFAYTFRGLGQLMHLVSDMSVPSHTRDDFHYYYNYEEAVETIRLSGDVNIGKTYYDAIAHPVNYGSVNQFADLFDREIYTGHNPEVTVNRKDIGLAEYTNANFFSEDTVNTPYILPNTDRNIFFNNGLPECVYMFDKMVSGSDGVDRLRTYYMKDGCGETGASLGNIPAGYRLAAQGFLYWYNSGREPKISDAPLLDDKVYEDYASLLIPRAVGYSADMLKYFFRGDISLEKDGSGNYFIKNKSAESLSGGFSIYYDYDTTAEKGLRRKLTINGAGGDGALLADIGAGGSLPISFVEPSATAGETIAEPGKYILVFRGGMGSEQDAVAGFVTQANTRWEDWSSGRIEYLQPRLIPPYYDGNHLVPGVGPTTEQYFSIRTSRHEWQGYRGWENNPVSAGSPSGYGYVADPLGYTFYTYIDGVPIIPEFNLADGKLAFNSMHGFVGTTNTYARLFLTLSDVGGDPQLKVANCLMKVRAPDISMDYSHQPDGGAQSHILLRMSLDNADMLYIRYGITESNATYAAYGANTDISRRFFIGTPDIKDKGVERNIGNDLVAYLDYFGYPAGYSRDTTRWRISGVEVHNEIDGGYVHGIDYRFGMSIGMDYIDFEGCR